jgi:glycosyltransferase involved in cell wall biosynthesis
MPTFNRRHMIGRALHSVLKQTWPEIEIIVVDDGSTDGTAELVRGEFADPRVRVLALDTNSGAAAARNRGLDVARGRYCAFLDSDDHWLPTKLAGQVRILVDAPSSAALCGFKVSDGRRLRTAIPRSAEANDVASLLNAKQEPIVTSCIMIDRNVVPVNLRFDERLRVLEDLDFVCQAVTHGPVSVDRRPTVHKRLGDWHRLYDADSAAQSRILIIDKYRPQLSLAARSQVITRVFLQTRDHEVLTEARSRGDLQFAERLVARLRPTRRAAFLMQSLQLGRSLTWSRIRRRALDHVRSAVFSARPLFRQDRREQET